MDKTKKYLPITIIEIGNTKHAAMSKNTQHERPKESDHFQNNL